jgi:hypothetical protein
MTFNIERRLQRIERDAPPPEDADLAKMDAAFEQLTHAALEAMVTGNRDGDDLTPTQQAAWRRFDELMAEQDD